MHRVDPAGQAGGRTSSRITFRCHVLTSSQTRAPLGCRTSSGRIVFLPTAAPAAARPRSPAVVHSAESPIPPIKSRLGPADETSQHKFAGHGPDRHRHEPVDSPYYVLVLFEYLFGCRRARSLTSWRAIDACAGGSAGIGVSRSFGRRTVNFLYMGLFLDSKK